MENDPDLESPNSGDIGVDDREESNSNYIDGSGRLFSMYLDRAEEQDKKMTESWKGDADGILVFTGLFSASVAALLAVSIPSLLPNPQDTSAFYLANIHQLLAQDHGINATIPPSLNNPADSFTPPTSAVWVNGLWFLSLMISLTCALLATLLQQWARRYLKVTCPRYAPHKRARVRAFYAEGVEKLHLPWTVEMLPILLHISLFLFFAGLSVFVLSVNLTIFKVVIAWVGLCVIVYAWLTFMPVFHKNSPYSAPLSEPLSFCVTDLRYTVFWLLERFTHTHFYISCLRFFRNRLMAWRHGNLSSDNLFSDPDFLRPNNISSNNLRGTPEDFAFRLDPVIDYRALKWTFDSLDEDHELEMFFEGVPNFCKSQAMANSQEGFIRPNRSTLQYALIGFMDRTLTSNLISNSVKQRRITICTKVIEATSLLGAWYTLHRVLLKDWQGFLKSVEFGLFVQGLKDIREVTTFYAKCVMAVIISSVQERDRDERWFQLVLGQLNLSTPVARGYHRDSISLAALIHISRQAVETCSGSDERRRGHMIDAYAKTVEFVCKVDFHRTSPGLKHGFCGLWNQLIYAAHDDKNDHASSLCVTVLKHIRKVYITLHEKCTDTHPTAFTNNTDDWDSILDDKGSYSKCDNEDHCSNSSPPVPPLQINQPSFDGGGNAGHAGTRWPMTNTPPLLFPMASAYSHASAQASSLPGSIPFSVLPDPRYHGHGFVPYDVLSAQQAPSAHHHMTQQTDSSHLVPHAHMFGRTTIRPPPVNADSRDEMETQAPSSSCPTSGLAFSPPQDNKSSQSTGEGICYSQDSERSDREMVLSELVIIAGIIANIPERDDRWMSLAMTHLGISKDSLWHYLAHGDSVLLANLVHTTRRFFGLNREHDWVVSSVDHTLPTISKFDIRNTLPELRHDFCALWNEITQEANNRESDHISRFILKHIRHLYIALHQDTNAAPTTFNALTDDNASVLGRPSSYPLCNIPSHHPTHTSITSLRADPPAAVLNNITSMPPSFPATTPDHSPIHLLEQSSLFISPLCSTLQSSGTVDQQSNTIFDIVLPPLVPENQPSSPPAPIHSDTLPTDPLTCIVS